MPHATDAEYNHIKVEQLAPTFAAQVTGVDFSKPIEKEVFDEILRAITDYGVLVFRHAGLDDARHVAFAALFGELDDIKPYIAMGRKNRFAFDELFDVSNLEDDGSLVKLGSKRDHMGLGNTIFHVDSSFNPRRAGYSLLRSHKLPPPGHGGNTDFADTRTAFAELPEELQKELSDNDYIGAHSLMHSRKKAAPKDSPYLKDIEPNDYAFGRHSVLQTHGPSGRPTMYIANHMHHLEYKTPRSKDFVPTPQQPYERVPEPEGTELIEKLLAHATQEKYVLSIEWQNEGDLVVWDNTAVMHKAGTGTFQEKYARDMRRATGPKRTGSKVYSSADHAVSDITDGSTILSSGFGLCGVPETLIDALRKKGTKNLTVVSNNAGAGQHGLTKLTTTGQISRMIVSFIGNNKPLGKQYHDGEVAIELCPQGTIAERLRAAGAGIPAFFTATGANTLIQTGGIPHRLGPKDPQTGKHEVLEPGRPRETRIFDGRTYMMETALQGDVAIVRAWKADEAGNCIFRTTTKAYGVLMPKAAKLAIVEAENIVPVGSLDPDHVDLPGIYIDRIVPATSEKHFEKLVLAPSEDGTKETSEEAIKRNRIAKRAAKELHEGFYVNLGVGIPTLAPSYLPPQTKVWIQSENGIVGMGPYPATKEEADPDTVNAGKETVLLVPGASTFDSAESFGMIRGGHVDVSLLGALQVSASGDLANYIIPGKAFNGMGGAMDLVSNPDRTKIVVCTYHTDKDGNSKVLDECELPLTGKGVVSTIITELAVFQVDREGGGGLTLTEVAEGLTVEDVKAKTRAKFAVAENVKTF